MIAAKSGTILNIIANYALDRRPRGVVHSASAKAGVLAMTQTLAVEWARHKIPRQTPSPPARSTPRAPRSASFRTR